ncbi:hypothetical protein NHJ6243_009965, partial [Beauveria neobassiana]
MPSLISCLLAGLAVADRAAAASYSLSKTYDSSNFLDEFHFLETDQFPWGLADNGHWGEYQNVKDAVDKRMASVKDNKVYLGVDSETELDIVSAQRPAALRVQSKESFREGLVITRFYHMPKPVCGAWPAYWTLGGDEDWKGEIDMYRGWNLNAANKPIFHAPLNPKFLHDAVAQPSTDECYESYRIPAQTANFISRICHENHRYLVPWVEEGCQSEEVKDGIWGSPDGGIQALERTKDTIKLYTWQIGKEPKNIDSKNPDTSSWGKPSVQLTSPGCDTSKAFGNHTILFTLTFCGDRLWKEPPADGKSGKTCKQITGAETCAEYVAGNPEAFKDFYFGINDVRIFVQDAEESDDNNANTKGQLSLEGSSPSLTFEYATNQSSSDNWIGIWPEDDTQAPTWGSITWDYARESSGSLQLTPPSSMK